MEHGYRIHREEDKGYFVTYYEPGKPPCELVSKEGTAKTEADAEEVIQNDILDRASRKRHEDIWFDAYGNRMQPESV